MVSPGASAMGMLVAMRTQPLLLVVCSFLLGCPGPGNGDDDDAAPLDDDDAAPGGDRLYFATGEYDPSTDWHAVLRFEGAESIDSLTTGPAEADGTLNVQATGDAAGISLNFAHDIHVDESRDELWMSALFTTEDGHPCAGPGEVCGSIGVVGGASSLGGSAGLDRHLFGPSTEINQPHGIWIDGTRDMLYAANTFSMEVLVWHSASTADGDLAPDRDFFSWGMGAPVDVFVQSDQDRAFIASMNVFGAPEPLQPQVLIYDDVSTLDGQVDWDYRIVGPSTRLAAGNNQTTHNVWFDADSDLLFVGHHTNEVLIFDLGPMWGNPGDHDLTPRVLRINEDADGSDEFDWSAYGFVLDPVTDELYVSAGYTPGNSEFSGPPEPGSPRQAIKVYGGALEPTFGGNVTPSREIHWTSGNQYWPAQPLWLTKGE